MSGCFARILQICLTVMGLLLIFIVVRFFALESTKRLPEQTAAPRLVITSVAAPANGASAVAGGATAIPVAIVIPEDISLSFRGICDPDRPLTRLQEEGVAASVANQPIADWAGQIYGVEQAGESYKVLVDMRADGVAARQVEIIGVSRDLAHTLPVEQQIHFTGTITEVVVGAAGICDPITITDSIITIDP